VELSGVGIMYYFDRKQASTVVTPRKEKRREKDVKGL
jgi:hypothetical protein